MWVSRKKKQEEYCQTGKSYVKSISHQNIILYRTGYQLSHLYHVNENYLHRYAVFDRLKCTRVYTCLESVVTRNWNQNFRNSEWILRQEWNSEKVVRTIARNKTNRITKFLKWNNAHQSSSRFRCWIATATTTVIPRLHEVTNNERLTEINPI